MKKRMTIMLIIVAVILGGIYGFQIFKGIMIKKYMASMGGQPQTVSTIVASSQEWSSTIEAVGSMRAVRGVDISSEVAGIVEGIYFDSGDDVQNGTLLVTLRSDDDTAKLASLKAAEKLAETTYKRDLKQLKAQAVSKATVDTDSATLDSAIAQVTQQQALLEKKFISAPFNGRLGIRNVDLGQYVNPGTAIVTLQTLDPIYMDFYLPQASLAQLREGQAVTVKNNTYPDKEFAGQVAAINSKVDESTRNVEVRVQLANPEHLLLPGMYSTVSINLGNPQHYLTIPQTAITYNPYGDTVFVVTEKEGDDGKGEKQLVAQQRFVTPGATRGDQVAVLKGLKEGETIVTSGQIKLQNGSAVTVNNTVVPDNKANPAPSEH